MRGRWSGGCGGGLGKSRGGRRRQRRVGKQRFQLARLKLKLKKKNFGTKI